MNTVAAVVVAHGPAAPVGAALAAAREALGDRLAEAVVVDNASPDDPAPAAAAAGARLLAFGENAGYAAAAAAGAAATSAPFVLFANPDAALLPGDWGSWIDRLAADETAAAQAPRIVGPGGAPIASVYRFPTPLRAFAEASGLSALRRRALGPREVPDARTDVDYAQGSCLLVRRAAWEAVGPFDPAYFLYHEEMDWAWRARGAGWRIVYDPAVACRHAGGVEVPPGREDLYWSGLARFAGRSPGGGSIRAAIRAGLVLSWPVHALLSPVSARARARAVGVMRALGAIR